VRAASLCTSQPGSGTRKVRNRSSSVDGQVPLHEAAFSGDLDKSVEEPSTDGQLTLQVGLVGSCLLRCT
jgi:hypothetical protein